MAIFDAEAKDACDSSRSFGVGRGVAGLAFRQRLRLDVDPLINKCPLTDSASLAFRSPIHLHPQKFVGKDLKIVVKIARGRVPSERARADQQPPSKP